MDRSLGVGDNLKTEYGNQIIVGNNNESPQPDASIVVADGEDNIEHNSLVIYQDGRIVTVDGVDGDYVKCNEINSKEMFLEENRREFDNVWDGGICDTAAGDRPKIVTTENGDFEAVKGNIIVVTFANTTSVYGYLNVDGQTNTLVRIKDTSQTSGYGPVNGTSRTWEANREYVLLYSDTNPETGSSSSTYSFWEISSAPTTQEDEVYNNLEDTLKKLGWNVVFGAGIDLKKLSDKLAGVLASKYELPTNTTSISNTTYRTGSINFVKRFGVVMVSSQNDFKTFPANSWMDFGTIPEGFRPAIDVGTRILNNTQLIIMYAYADGRLRFYNYGTAITSNTNGALFGMWLT